MFAVHPSTLLQIELELRGVTPAELSRLSGLPRNVVDQILSGAMRITVDLANRIETGLGLSALELLRVQREQDAEAEVLASVGAA